MGPAVVNRAVDGVDVSALRAAISHACAPHLPAAEILNMLCSTAHGLLRLGMTQNETVKKLGLPTTTVHLYWHRQ